MDERVVVIERHLSALATRVDEMNVRLAVKDEREKRVDEKLEEIKKDVEKLNVVAGRVGWLVIATIISMVLKFVMEGGLQNVS